MRVQSTLNGETLPWHFHYSVFVPPKREFLRRTQNGVVRQRSSPYFIIGDTKIQWSLSPANGQEAKQLLDFYRLDGDMVFTGHWGESYIVSFTDMQPLQVKENIWELSGEFLVVCETSEADPDCGNPV